nr:hypothetical protein [Tanacetum cinerariifolium]
METTIDQQVAPDEALVPSTKRLRIGRSNFRLPSDIQSKESTLQVVYDVLRNSPFFRAFQVTADVLEIYMQEFWATAKLHHNSIRFKMDTKKSVLNLEAFREMLHISPRIPSQSFAELPSKEEILEFLRYLGHSHEIRHLTDVNVNKLYQPWRLFASVINKCLTGKSSGIDSFRLSQAQILWGFYHRINIDYAYLIWEDFVYQVEHKNQKRSNEMYYPRFTKVVIDYFMTRKPSIPRGNRINWHYVRDDVLFSTIKVAYKEYYACAMGEATPKPKASARKKKGDSASSTTPPTPTPTTTVVTALRLSAAAKGKQPARATTPTEPTYVERTKAEQLKIVLKRSRQETHISQQCGSGTVEGTGSRPGVPDVPSDDSEEELSWNSSDDEEGDEQTKGREEREGDKTDESDDRSDDDDETVKAGSERDKDDDDNDDEEDIAKNDDEDKESGKGGDEVSESEGESDEEETRQEEEESFDPIPRTPKGSEDEGSDEEDQELRLSEEARIQKEEEADELYRDININQGRGLQLTQNIEDSHVTLTPIHPDGPQESSSVSSFVTSMLNPISDAAFRFDERLRSLETTFSEYRQTNPFVDDVSVIPGNKSIQRSDEQRNLYKALVEAYDADKAILDTYGESTILKRRREDDDQEGPFAGSDRSTIGSQSRQMSASESAFAEEPVQTTCQMEEPPHPVFKTGADDQPIVQTSQHPEWFSQPKRPPSPDRDWNQTLPATQGDAKSWISVLARQTDARSTFNELLDTPIDFSNFIMNRLNIDTLTLALLAGSTYELMRGSCTSLTELEYHLEEVYKATMDQFAVNRESALDVYSKRRIIAVTKLKIVEWHNYKHLDWILVRRDDDKIYIFKEGDFKRLRLQYIKDMLLILVQGKLSNLTVEERFAFNVSLRMFTRSIVIQRRVEDLQLGVKSYQKRLNLTKPDTYRPDLKRREAYTAHSNPRGFIYQNKDKKNRLMRIDKLHKFSDGTLNDVRNALDDRLKGIRMQYFSTTIWRRGDKDRAAAMIQAI